MQRISRSPVAVNSRTATYRAFPNIAELLLTLLVIRSRLTFLLDYSEDPISSEVCLQTYLSRPDRMKMETDAGPAVQSSGRR